MEISDERYSLNIHEVAEDLSIKHSLSKFLLLEVDTTYERDQTCNKLEEWFLRDQEHQKIELLHFHKLQEIVKRALLNITLYFVSDDLEYDSMLIHERHIGSQALKSVLFSSKHKKFAFKSFKKTYQGEIRVLKEDYKKYVNTKRKYSYEELSDIICTDLETDTLTTEAKYLCWIVSHNKHDALMQGGSLEQKQLLRTFDPENEYDQMGIAAEKAAELYKIFIPEYTPRRGRPKVV